jgi:NAD(P)-dependent dehydrogenase (short-subunit alcohol dehydrogenase family)
MSNRPVVLVTGAARRLGREMALDLASNGFDVAVHYHTSADDALDVVAQAQVMGVQAHAFAVDLSVPLQCQALVPSVLAHFGRLDAVVNNASAFAYDEPTTCTLENMDFHWRANTAPAVFLAQALHAHWQTRAGAGCVVNLLDQKLWNPNPDYFSYTLSKAALQAATVMLAQGLAPKVRVCGVAPGVTLVSGNMTSAEFESAHQLTPLHRSSTPQDIARTVRFLIESPAITGTTVLVDGGQHLQGQPRDVMFLARENSSPLKAS